MLSNLFHIHLDVAYYYSSTTNVRWQTKVDQTTVVVHQSGRNCAIVPYLDNSIFVVLYQPSPARNSVGTRI